jgi:hypothetical protein
MVGLRPFLRVVVSQSTSLGIRVNSSPNQAQIAPRAITASQWAILALGAAGIAWLHDAYGIGWDAYVRRLHGEMIRSYFLSLGADRTVNTHGDLRLYTALPDFLAALLYQGVPEFRHQIRHAVTAAFALATVPALFQIAKLLGRPWAGPIASLILFSLPVFFGHAFINSKDIPLAAAFTWALLGLVWLFQENRFSWPRVVVAGLALGFPLTIRPGIWPILVVMLVAVVVYSDLVARPARREGPERRSGWKLFALIGVSWATMVAVWPWAHENPLVHPLLGIWAAGSFPTVVPVLFEGVSYSSEALPRHYLLKMFGLKTPTPVLLLALGGSGIALARAWSDRNGRGLGNLVLAMWLLAPLAAWTLTTPNIYDGIRHFIFVLPALALCAALGVLTLLDAIRPPPMRWVTGVILVLLLAAPVADIVRLHPYEMTYYNRWAGGVGGAAERYETEYWVTSYREAAEWISEQGRSRGGPVRVLVAANELSEEAARHFLPADAMVDLTFDSRQQGELPPHYDYYMATTRYRLSDNFPGTPVVFSVGREGATFAVVRGHRAPAAPGGPEGSN